MKTVEIKIDTFGNTKVDANGFVGNSCAASTKPFIDALGGKDVVEELKPEYSQQNTATVGNSW